MNQSLQYKNCMHGWVAWCSNNNKGEHLVYARFTDPGYTGDQGRKTAPEYISEWANFSLQWLNIPQLRYLMNHQGGIVSNILAEFLISQGGSPQQK